MRFNIRWLMRGIAILALCLWEIRAGIVRNVVSLGLQAPLFGILMPWFSLAAFGGLVLAWIAVARDKRLWWSQWRRMLLPLVSPLLILLAGAAFWKGDDADSSSNRLVSLIQALVWFPLPIGTILLACFRTRWAWLFIIGITIVATWFSFCCSAVSIMAVTNVWL